MWVLLLNDMRSSKIEYLNTVCKANTKEELLTFIESQKVPHYKTPASRFEDGPKGIGTELVEFNYSKGFKAGGPLEWFNQPSTFNDSNYVEVADFEPILNNIKTVNELSA